MERTNTFCEFLVELTSAAFGGGKSEDEVGLDDGEGMEDMEDKHLLELKELIGEEDFYKQYPKMKGVI